MKCAANKDRSGDKIYYIGWGIIFVEIAISVVLGMNFGFYIGILSFFIMLSLLLISIGIVLKEKVATIFGIVLLCIANPFIFNAFGLNPMYGVVVSILIAAVSIFALGGVMHGRHKEKSGGGEVSP